MIVSSNDLCGVTVSTVETPRIFHNVLLTCQPIATKSRKFNDEDKLFIKEEVRKLLNEQIIEPSYSPWRAQVLVARDGRHKPRMVVDYSQTVNRYTLLDAYPLPNINEQIIEIAKWNVFSTLDLKSAIIKFHFAPLIVRLQRLKQMENCTNILAYLLALLMVCHVFKELWIT